MLAPFDRPYMVFQGIDCFRILPCFDVILGQKRGLRRQAGEIVESVHNHAVELVDFDKVQGDSVGHIVGVTNILKRYNILWKFSL